MEHLQVAASQKTGKHWKNGNLGTIWVDPIVTMRTKLENKRWSFQKLTIKKRTTDIGIENCSE